MMSRDDGNPVITVRWAETDAERLQLYRLRARIFFGEDILRGNRGAELFDIYDCYRSTRNVVAVQIDTEGSSRVVGGCRLTHPADGIGILDSPLYDFRPLVGPDGPTTALGSMLCVEPEARGRHDIGHRVIEFAVAHGLRPEITAICSAVRPGLVPFLTRLGWQVLEPEFLHPTERIPVVPMWWRVPARAEVPSPSGGSRVETNYGQEDLQ
jgi:N-acyl-L-homoserine lactone synthetase